MYPILYPLVLATLGAGAPAEEVVKPPQGPQPTAVIARIFEDGRLMVQTTVPVTTFVAETRTIVQCGVARVVTVTKPVMRIVIETRAFTTKDLQGYDTRGKKIDADTVRRRLKKDTAVLISADGKPVDPFYLKVAREGTLVLVVPAFAGGETPMTKPGGPLPKGDEIKKLPKD